MLYKYTNLSAIFIWCIAIGSSTSQSSDNGMAAESALAVSDYPQLLQPALSAYTDPVISQLSNDVVQAFSSSEYLKDYTNFEFTNFDAFFLQISIDILLRGGFNEPKLAELVGQAVASYDVLTSTKYFESVGNILAKFLHSKGLLTDDNTVEFSQAYLSVVEDLAKSRGVTDTESLITSVAFGLYDYISSLGFDDLGSFAQMYFLFVYELAPDIIVALAETSAGASQTA